MARQNLNGKKVIISGISSGIGKEIARILIEKYDCEVYGIARNEDKIVSFKNELSKSRNLVGYSLFDVATEQNWINLQSELENIGFKAQILINCAGFLPPFARFERCKPSDIEKVLQTNFLSCVYSTHHLLPILKQSGFFSIVNVSSSASLATFAGISGYASSKSALKSFSLCLSAEFGKSAYVGCICPGFSNTDVFRNQSASEKDFNLIRKLSTSPQKIAKNTVKAIKAKKKLKIIGYDAKLMNFFYKLMPITTSKIITKILKKSGMQLFKNL